MGINTENIALKTSSFLKYLKVLCNDMILNKQKQYIQCKFYLNIIKRT